MGFSAIPPGPDNRLLVQSLDTWVKRADAAIMHVDVPWGALLDGVSAPTAARALVLELANYYRAHNLAIVFMIDATNGIARNQEAAELVARNRSITEPAVQRLYRQWVVAVADIVRPAHLGLVAETNLVRAIAPRPVYDALVRMANDAVADLRAAGLSALPVLYVSAQVEVAWGRPNGVFIGVEQDLRDFPFTQALGLSSYPYLGGFSGPDQLPADYYSRLRGDRALPVLVVEGGWPSTSVAGVTSSPATQAVYLARQTQLLERADAVALFQLTFTDLDLPAFPATIRPGLLPFAALGVVDSQLRPKPALAAWDSTFARPLRR